jgi:hypothetical protein
MRVRGLAVGAAATGLALAGCGGDEHAFTPVPQPTTTSQAAPAGGTQTSGSVHVTLTDLGPHYNRVFAQLIQADDALMSAADDVNAAASGAQKLVDKVAAGYTPPSGSAPQLARLHTALTAFSDALSAMATDSSLLPQLAAQLQVRSRQVIRKHPASAARLLTAKQRVDTTVASVAALENALRVASAKVRDQSSKVTVNANGLASAVDSGTEATSAALAKVSDAVDGGFEALVAAA